MVIRSAGLAVVLLVGYALLPLDRIADVPLWLTLTLGLLMLVAVSAVQVRSVLRSSTPGLRAVEAISVTLTLFLLLFATSYAVMTRVEPGSFDVPPMTRLDGLYFTVTVFATVGFGDLSPVSQVARAVVTTQMVLDLLLLGLGIRVFVSAVEESRQRSGGSRQ